MSTEDEKLANLFAFMKDMRIFTPTNTQLIEMRRMSRWKGIPLSRSVSLRPSDIVYLNTFSSVAEGIQFLVRESMARNVSNANREFLRQLDFAAKIEPNHALRSPRQKIERERLREELLNIGTENDNALPS